MRTGISILTKKKPKFLPTSKYAVCPIRYCSILTGPL